MHSFGKRITVCVLLLIAFSLPSRGADCPIGDLNGDCTVGPLDLGVLGSQWLDTPGGSANLDGVPGVTLADFAIFAEHWMQQGGLATVVINEFMADNNHFYFDNVGNDDDWIEIYNYGEPSRRYRRDVHHRSTG